MTRRFFSSITAAIAAIPTKTVAFTRSAILRKPAYQITVPLKSHTSSVRQSLWIFVDHSDAVRFSLGAKGQEPITCGMIHPPSGTPAKRVQQYLILSVKGLKTEVPIALTLSSKKPVVLNGYQEVFNYPYAIRNTTLAAETSLPFGSQNLS